MTEAALPRAPVALWSIGFNLARVPGREQQALDALRRFLDESTPLASAEDVARYRSEATTLIDELQARVPVRAAAELAPAREPQRQGEADGDEATSVSPIGPVVLGVGAAALLAGVATGIASLVLAADFREACQDLSMCPTQLRPQYDEMRAVSTAADVTTVAGGLVAAVGLVLTLTLTDGNETPTASAACTNDGCAVALMGRF